MLSRVTVVLLEIMFLLPAAGRSAIHNISISGFDFVPVGITIAQGDSVRWTNNDGVPHTSTSDNGVWSSPTLNFGQSYIFAFNNPGSFPYHCAIHPSMRDTITVVAPADVEISIGEYFFSPAVLQIQPGQTVQWMNNGIRVHTTTSDIGLWDSDSLDPGQTFHFTFANEGVFHYHCDMHPLLMKGTIVVGRPDSVAHDIRIIDNDFDPATLTIMMGENVRWLNFGAMQHTTIDTSSNAWDSGTLDPGDFFIYHSGTPGDFHYVCSIHPGMDGILTVQDTATGGGCVYVPGDINGNGSANGIDVTYGVAYLKGGTPPPVDCSQPCAGVPDPFYAAGDVNGNCGFNGIDITYYVAYLKGLQPSLLHCPTCPPATSSRASR